MITNAASDLEKRILELPKNEQADLIGRIKKNLRRHHEKFDEAELLKMANDQDIQRELREIELDFATLSVGNLSSNTSR